MEWFDADKWEPKCNGHYLVLQKRQDRVGRASRVVKYWKDGAWQGVNEEYGEVRLWMVLPPIPDWFT